MTDQQVSYTVRITADTPEGPLELCMSGQCDGYDRIGNGVASVCAQFFASLRVVHLDPCWASVFDTIGPTVGLPDDVQFLAFLHRAWPALNDEDYRGWYRIIIDHAKLRDALEPDSRDALEPDSTSSARLAARLAFIARHARAKGLIVSGDRSGDADQSPHDSG